jgi:hypothetical protein
MVWSHNDLWLLTGDHGGFVKYWQSNMNNVKMYEAHKEPVRGLRWARYSSITHSNWILFFLALILLYHKIKFLVEIFNGHSLVHYKHCTKKTVLLEYISIKF